jgi:hypothetical protein
MKVVVNRCFGGFGLSPKALLWLWDRGVKEIGTPVKDYYGGDSEYNQIHGGWEVRFHEDLAKWRSYIATEKYSVVLTVFSPDLKYALSDMDIERTHPLLIECVETLEVESFGWAADLEVVEIPDGIEWEIEENDGQETIAEKHRTW